MRTLPGLSLCLVVALFGGAAASGPVAKSAVSAGKCPRLSEVSHLAYRPGGGRLRGDVDGDGRRDEVSIRYAPSAPASCGIVLVVETRSKNLAMPVAWEYQGRPRQNRGSSCLDGRAVRRGARPAQSPGRPDRRCPRPRCCECVRQLHWDCSREAGALPVSTARVCGRTLTLRVSRHGCDERPVQSRWAARCSRSRADEQHRQALVLHEDGISPRERTAAQDA